MPEDVRVVTQVAYYARLPESLLLDPMVSSDACRLYALFTRYDWRRSHEVWPTWDTLGKELVWSRRKLARVIAELVEVGAIETHRKGRRPNVIVLLADVLEVPVPAPQDSLGCQEEPLGVPDPVNAPLTNETKNERARATRCPDPFLVSDDMAEWAERECTGVNWDRETEKFVDFWRAKSGQQAAKLDWVATWRNWMRKAAEGWR